LQHKTKGQSIVLPLEVGILGYGIYNIHAPHGAIGHPSTLIDNLTATRRNLERAYSSVPPIMGMLATIVVPTKPLILVHRKYI
jgi:hypothetical protein